MDRQREFIGDLAIGKPLRGECEDVTLALRQAIHANV
jgi:hypothetical protein